MNYKFIIAAFALILSIGATDVLAQRGSSTAKFRSPYKRKFKPSWTVFASPGLVVMNSENEGDSGDLDKYGVLKNNGMGPTLNVGAIYQFSNSFGVEGRLGYLNINGKEDARERERVNKDDVTFKTHAVEASASLIYNLTNTYVGSRFTRSRNLRLLVPYVKAGVGVVMYTSSSSIERQGVDFPDATSYPDIALVAPLGGGIKIQYSKQLTIAPELNVNFTTTDYLDNTSYGYKSPLTGKNDAYLTATVKVMYNITAHRRSPFRFRR
ncbi:outer membrane beta-barrel protein [Pontibacter sp. Tf4]|uniref:DUF6089 family protein n=1 Tax=Pontibacter sp. Tf4 TaxID=2761620 RepID=UPI001623B88C|nr:DUF6089 family protein [Pontibacter sp. Tf4]MBB6612724.1 outer membrane beta-barrel protein [Pontibacter sp. Tf4]